MRKNIRHPLNKSKSMGETRQGWFQFIILTIIFNHVLFYKLETSNFYDYHVYFLHVYTSTRLYTVQGR